MTAKQARELVTPSKEMLVILGLALNLAVALLSTGVLYGKIDAVLGRTVADVGELRAGLREEAADRTRADTEIRAAVGSVTERVARLEGQ